MMKVVQVSAQRDYEGTVWSALFSSVEQALEVLRNQPADTFAGVDDLVVAWVGVDSDSYERVLDLSVNFQWGDSDTVSFSRWNNDTKQSEAFSF
jgi:hypothetical protein